MKRLLLVLLLGTATVRSQDLMPPDTVNPIEIFWRHSISGTVGLTQVTYTDWAQGGENNFAYNLGVTGRSIYEDRDLFWSNSYKLGFGQTKVGQQEFRKNDDRIELESVATWKVDAYVKPYIATTLKTQFAVGYRFEAGGKRTPLSKFFDPAYLSQSIGAGYQIIPQVGTRFGAAVREIITSEYRSYSDDPKTKDKKEKVKVEDGVESVTDIKWPIEQNIMFEAKYELFTSFKAPENIVVRGVNTLTTRVGRMLTISLNLWIVNDHLVSPHTQMRQTFGIGVSYALL